MSCPYRSRTNPVTCICQRPNTTRRRYVPKRPSWAACILRATHQIQDYLREANVHYRLHNSPSLNHILINFHPINILIPASFTSMLMLPFLLTVGLPICLFPSSLRVTNYKNCYTPPAEIAQHVQRLVTACTVQGSNSGGGEIFRTRPDRSCSPLSLLKNGCRVIPRGKKAQAWC